MMLSRGPAQTSPMLSQMFEFTSGVHTDEDDTMREAKWIRRNIKMRECVCFVHDLSKTRYSYKNADSLCCCGYPYSVHKKRDTVIETPRAWSRDKNTSTTMTSSFGEIDFTGYEDIIRKYVRVDIQTSMNDMLQLLLDVWGLKKPNLLISVTGGAKNFIMKPKLKDFFRRGLIKVSRTTGAWILTGGTNTGVMKHVGEAVRDYRLTATTTDPVVAIGIATWGCIMNKEDLEDYFGYGKWPASYKIQSVSKEETCLDPNHTHFVLVDDGTQHRFGVEIPFRAKLENAITNTKTDTGKDAVSIPIVLLIVEGGTGSLQTAFEAITNGIPIVVVKGSGRIADIIAYAYQNSQEREIEEIVDGDVRKRGTSVVDDAVEQKLMAMMRNTFGEAKLEMHWSRVKTCLERRDLVTVFDINATYDCSSRDIDVAILKALLKANKNQVFDQLKLALAWNRIDIAKSEIFTDDTDWPPGRLNPMLHSAIEHNRVDFVELFLDNGVTLKEFLSKERLLQFYNNIPENSLLYSLLQRTKNKYGIREEGFTFRDVHRLIKVLIDINLQPYTSKSVSKATTVGGKGRQQSKNPFEDLFLWSVLVNQLELAKLFWKQGKDATAYALMAFGLMNAMAQRTDDTELRNKLKRNAVEFGNLAVGVLNDCYEADEKKTHGLLVHKLDQCDDANCLKIAVKTDNKQFISHKACQSFFRDMWMGELSSDNGTLRLLISPILLGLFILKVKEKTYVVQQQRENINLERDAEQSEYEETVVASDRRGKNSTMSRTECNNDHLYREKTYRLTGVMKLLYRTKCVYTAPVMIFAHSVIAYIVFLTLLSYFLLIELEEEICNIEILMWIWVLTLMIEELRQFSSPSSKGKRDGSLLQDICRKMRKKKKDYLSDDWNKLDIITLFVFAVGVVLRCLPNMMGFARVVFAFNVMLFFFRILHIFTVHKELGPKIIMIRRMMVDLTFFLIIMMVFVMSYAIAAYSVLYPNSELNYGLIQKIMRLGYWNLYGELFLDETEQVPPECTFNSTIYKQGMIPRCPNLPVVANVLMAVYVLFANVLLLNILIAMFSNTFQKVYENTDRHWNYMRCFLVYEFNNKPFLPAPLSLPMYLYLFMKWVIKRYCCCEDSPESGNDAIDRELIEWENVIADAYTQRLRKEDQDKMENKVAEVGIRVENLMTRMMEIQHGHHDTVHILDKRLDCMDSKVNQILKLLTNREPMRCRDRFRVDDNQDMCDECSSDDGQSKSYSESSLDCHRDRRDSESRPDDDQDKRDSEPRPGDQDVECVGFSNLSDVKF